MITFQKNKGFTLIELLVVIAIIGLLASVVLASLNSAKNKAKDAVLRQDVKELQKLMELEYNDTGKYVNFQPQVWVPANASCDDLFTASLYKDEARKVCNHIFANLPARSPYDGGTQYMVYFGNALDLNNKYSIIVALNTSNFFCAGSSGGTSENTPSQVGYWSGKGCYSNP